MAWRIYSPKCSYFAFPIRKMKIIAISCGAIPSWVWKTSTIVSLFRTLSPRSDWWESWWNGNTATRSLHNSLGMPDQFQYPINWLCGRSLCLIVMNKSQLIGHPNTNCPINWYCVPVLAIELNLTKKNHYHSRRLCHSCSNRQRSSDLSSWDRIAPVRACPANEFLQYRHI